MLERELTYGLPGKSIENWRHLGRLGERKALEGALDYAIPNTVTLGSAKHRAPMGLPALYSVQLGRA